MTDSKSGSGLNSELESFRQAWLSDLKTKKPEPGQPHLPSSSSQRRLSASSQSHPHQRQKSATARRPSTTHRRPVSVDEDDHYVPTLSFDDPPPEQGHRLDDEPGKGLPKELNSALDHFEEAMEKEAQGNMGDSLQLYRKAYRMDGGVDKRYREKYFPNAGQRHLPASQTASSSTTQAAATPAASQPAQPPVEHQPLSLADLISSFSTLKIEPADPVIPGDLPPPCPISEIPSELLVHILQDVAVDDVGDFVRLSRVCKHFAYLAATEERIWRRVCLGKEWGFPGMHYHYQRNIDWGELDFDEEATAGDEEEEGTLITPRELADKRLRESLDLTKALVPSAYPLWRDMFRSRPRVRFNGCYISTVNYIRPGLAGASTTAAHSSSTWGAPIHIVTYYRYLRFFRDGTLISLLTTNEPADVVHHLTRNALAHHRAANQHASQALPSAVMVRALKGRWRLSSPELSAPPSDAPAVSFATTVYTASRRNAAAAAAASASGEGKGAGSAEPPQEEGDIFIETEGVGAQYTYRVDLSLRSAGKGNRNNKLVWRGFWSHNRLTDDWGEFGLKNDKPFFFSRVKSYGKGED